MSAFLYFLLANFIIFVFIPFFLSFLVGEILNVIKKFKVEKRFSKNKKH